MSLSRIWVLALFLVGTIWWVNGAAVPNASGNLQPPPQRDGLDSPRNASVPGSADFKPLKPMEPTRQNSPNLPPPPQPFGINSNMQVPPQAPPQGFLMSPPPGFRPGMIMMPPPAVPQPTVSQPNMNAQNHQQGQAQQSKIPSMANSTVGHPLLLSTNASRANNTRREIEPSPVTPATTTSTTTTRKPFQESPLGADKQESDGSKMKQSPPIAMLQSPVPQSLPVNPFNPMMQPFPMMNQPLFIDPMGRLMMLVPFNPQLMPRDPNQQQPLPQGPPIPIQVPFNQQMQFQFGQPQLRPIMAELNKQPPRMGEASKNTTSTS